MLLLGKGFVVGCLGCRDATESRSRIAFCSDSDEAGCFRLMDLQAQAAGPKLHLEILQDHQLACRHGVEQTSSIQARRNFGNDHPCLLFGGSCRRRLCRRGRRLCLYFSPFPYVETWLGGLFNFHARRPAFKKLNREVADELVAGTEHIRVFNKLRRINKRESSQKSVLAAKTGFVSQLWHSLCERGCSSRV